MDRTRAALIVLAISLSAPAFAAQTVDLGTGGNSTGFKNFLAWFGVGAGNAQIKKPTAGVAQDGTLNADAGMLWLPIPWVGFTLGAMGELTSGHLDMDFTASDNVHYTASSVPYNASGAELQAGLVFRAINASKMHVYISGGGIYGTHDYSFNTDKTIYSSASTVKEADQKSVSYTGYFGEGGVDFMFGASGFRLAGKATQIKTGKIKAFKDQEIESGNSYAYAAFLRQF